MFAGLVNWFLGSLLAIFGVTGLFIAAKGGTADSYYFGLGLALICVLAIGKMVHGALHKGQAH